MAKKNSLKFIFDSPVVLVFSVVSAVIFISDLILKLNLSEKIFECPGAKSVPAFDFKSALSYVKLVIYPFGGENSTSFFLNIGFILLLGPVLEERYGSIMLALMIFITSLVGGVLTACVSTFGISGCGGIVFMMIILSVLSVFIKSSFQFRGFLFLPFILRSLFSAEKRFQDLCLLCKIMFLFLFSLRLESAEVFLDFLSAQRSVLPKSRKSSRKKQLKMSRKILLAAMKL